MEGRRWLGSAVACAASYTALWCGPEIPSGWRVTGGVLIALVLALVIPLRALGAGIAVAFVVALFYASGSGRSVSVSAATTTYRAAVALAAALVGAAAGWLVRRRRSA